MTLITPELAKATLALPHLTPVERDYLTAVATGDDKPIRMWPRGLVKQRDYLLQFHMLTAPCPVCHEPIAEIASRTKDDAGEGDHACPHCLVRLSHHIGLIDGDQFWVLQPGQTVQIR